jgi:Zn-dependent protease
MRRVGADAFAVRFLGFALQGRVRGMEGELVAIPAGLHPELAAGVETRDFGGYGIAASPKGQSFLHLESDEFAAFADLDGTRSPDELTAKHGPSVTDLLDDLWEDGFLVGSVEAPPRRATVTLQGVEFGGFHRVANALYRWVGRPVFSRAGAVTIAAVSVAGLVAAGLQASAGRRFTVGAASPIVALVVLRLLGFLATFLHESGHALVIERGGRRVGRVGIGFYWGLLTFYVDASPALFFERRTRMLQAAAGVITDMVLSGIAAVVASFGGDATWAVVLREFAVLGFIAVVLNLVPLLELDGYWFLADALDRPTLHRDATAAMKNAIRRRPADRRLAAYGAASLVFGLAMFVVDWGVWWGLFGGLFHRLWAGGVGYKILAIYLVLPYLATIGQLLFLPVRAARKHRTNQPARSGQHPEPPPGP